MTRLFVLILLLAVVGCSSKPEVIVVIGRVTTNDTWVAEVELPKKQCELLLCIPVNPSGDEIRYRIPIPAEDKRGK